jgi:23S rRNA (uracil1939-C5)-methyltransferase
MIQVQLLNLVYGGECLGRLADGRAVFVPYGLPGELVAIDLVEDKKRFARGRIVEILRPSPERIQPRCAHFGECGGCHYQHLTYERQLAAKQAILIDQLRRIAGVTVPPVEDIVPSPSPWNYRNTVQFHLNEEGRLGYQSWGGSRVVAIRECHLPEQTLNELWPLLDFEPLPGLERIELRLGADGEALLALETNELELPEFEVDIPLSAVLRSPAGQIVLVGDDHLVMEVLGKPFKVSAGSFFQVNTPMAGAMVETLLDWLPVNRRTTLLDVYCGVGLFSAFFAPRVGRCIGIESSESACADYAVNLDACENVELYVGLAEEVLPALNRRGEVIIVDPPRAGLEIAALDALTAMQPEAIAYVSCDPATLARDAARLLRGGYRLERVRPFDLFPQTYHIESISLFKRG